ncbi:MAG: formimidoylglutamase [Deltaproteobacteria bacterium]|nr:formimidoylglutamase [Deltaproteobacteria bacterium]
MTKTYQLIGFPCDEGVRRNNGRPGAAQGPKAFRQHWQATNNCEDLGDINCHESGLEAAQKTLGDRVYQILSGGHHSIVIGGGHEIAWGHFQGISRYLGSKNCGIINFDAHFDLRPLIDNKLGSSGTPFLQIAKERQNKNLDFDYLVLGIQPASNSNALFQTAKELNVKFVLAENFERESLDQIDAILSRHEYIYLSICLDVFAKTDAPGVSAPQALGLSPERVKPLLRRIKQSGKVIALDIAELAPAYDIDNKTAKLAASLTADWIAS